MPEILIGLIVVGGIALGFATGDLFPTKPGGRKS